MSEDAKAAARRASLEGHARKRERKAAAARERVEKQYLADPPRRWQASEDDRVANLYAAVEAVLTRFPHESTAVQADRIVAACLAHGWSPVWR